MANPQEALAYHGGSLSVAARMFPQAPKPWLDLSTGVNALPYPFAPPSRDAFARLPEAESIAALEAAAAQFFGVAEEASCACVAAPGTQALLQLLPRLIPAKKVGVLGFTYAEHGRCWAASGAEVFIAETLEDLLAAEVAVIVNPNNPDGRVLSAETLRDVAANFAARGKWLIVDEAFADFTPETSLAPLLPLPGVVVLRSFGKVFGLAGLRLGFTLSVEPFGKRLRAALGPWAVSGAAVEIGEQAYGDAGWLAQSAARLAGDGAALDEVLATAGFDAVGATPLFRLVRHPQAAAVFEKLCHAGILVRPFADKPEWLRFGIPHGANDFDRLRENINL